MSHEVFRIVEALDQRELETQLALQCAPLLMRIKISNLLIIHKSNKDAVIKLFRKTEISYFMIYELEDKIIFLLYRKNELISYLNSDQVKKVMKLLGYNFLELTMVLKEISKRYASYMKEKTDFPHEMGLLLGYPVDDVVGFIENEGQNFLYIGYWKVYNNLSDMILLFDQYNHAKEMVIRMISQGVNISNILGLNNSNQYKQSVV